MQHIKLFNQHSDFENFVGGADYIEPHVSLCAVEGHVNYNKRLETIITLSAFGAGELLINAASNIAGIEITQPPIPIYRQIDMDKTIDGIRYYYWDFAFDGFYTTNCEIGRRETPWYWIDDDDYIEDMGTHVTNFIDTNTGEVYSDSVLLHFNSNLDEEIDGVHYYAIGDMDVFGQYQHIGFITDNTPGTHTNTYIYYDLGYLENSEIFNYVIRDSFKVPYTAGDNQKIKIKGKVDSVALVPDFFDGCLPSNVTIKEIIIPEGVTLIPTYGFVSPTLEKITLPNTIETIGDYAFAWCEMLSDINIPSSLQNLGVDVFDSCEFAEHNLINDSNFDIPTEDDYYPNIIENCTEINHMFITDDGVLENTRSGISGEIHIPSTVNRIVHISSYGYNYKYVTKIVIPTSVISIEKTFNNVRLAAGEYIHELYYEGTVEQWRQILVGGKAWGNLPYIYVVHCTDGDQEYLQ